MRRCPKRRSRRLLMGEEARTGNVPDPVIASGRHHPVEPVTATLAILGAVVALADRALRDRLALRRERQRELCRQARTLPDGSRLVDLSTGLVIEVGPPCPRGRR